MNKNKRITILKTICKFNAEIIKSVYYNKHILQNMLTVAKMNAILSNT